MQWQQIYLDIELRLFPHFECDVWERSHYYYLLSRTRIVERESATIPLAEIADALSCSTYSSRKILRNLGAKGCINLEQTRSGHRVRVNLPHELGIPESTEDALPEIDIEKVDFFKNREYLENLLARENQKCFYCLRNLDSESCELDHVISQVKGGDNSYRNIVAACHKCNTQKRDLEAPDLLRKNLRGGMLSDEEFQERMHTLNELQEGKLVPIVSGVAR